MPAVAANDAEPLDGHCARVSGTASAHRPVIRSTAPQPGEPPPRRSCGRWRTAAMITMVLAAAAAQLPAAAAGLLPSSLLARLPAQLETADGAGPVVSRSQPGGDDRGPGEAAAAGLRVWIDPQTGALSEQPTPLQRRALEIQRQTLAASRRPAQPLLFELPDGTRGAFLDGAFLGALHVHRAPDGALSPLCREIHPGSSAGHPAHRAEPPSGAADLELQ